MKKKFDVCIVGGLGHVGLPLGIVFASKGLKVCLQDVDETSAAKVKSGSLPFIEYGAEPLLKEALESNNLSISLSPESIAECKYLIIAIGTPIDEFMNPKTRQFLEFISEIKPYLDCSQTIIIRSSVAPRTCEQILYTLGEDIDWNLCYCPERIVQGYAVQELEKLPQIIAGFSEKAVESASELFSKISSSIIKTTVAEAEMAKLFSNSWRYLQFAAANQFYMICEDLGIDYDKVRFSMVDGYERAAQLPSAGFAAGPCLLKDTMQISSIYSNFLLGHSAMMINEGLPNYLVNKLRAKYELKGKKVGILGMAFKANIDDIRDSLSFKLFKILKQHGAEVLCSDEYATNHTFVTKEELISRSSVIIIGVPHEAYKKISIPNSCEVIDLWNVFH